jgi:hypothetical protein
MFRAQLVLVLLYNIPKMWKRVVERRNIWVRIKCPIPHAVRNLEVFNAGYHGLNMELDLQSLFGLLCTAVLIGWDPATPPPFPPHLGSYQRALLVSQDRRHLLVTPSWILASLYSTFALEYSVARLRWNNLNCNAGYLFATANLSRNKVGRLPEHSVLQIVTRTLTERHTTFKKK